MWRWYNVGMQKTSALLGLLACVSCFKTEVTMSRETLGTGAAPRTGVGGGAVQNADPSPDPDPSNFCRVIVVTSDPDGTLDRDAGTVAVLNATPGLESRAPGVWFNPRGGTGWIKLAPILSATGPSEPLDPGTFLVDENDVLWVYVDATTTGAVPLSFLKTLYEHRERLADLWENLPGTVASFNQESDPIDPILTGRSGVELDGVTFPARIGDRFVSENGKRAYERWGVIDGPTGNVFFRPLHRELTQGVGSGLRSHILSPDLLLWKTGPCKVILRGHLGQEAGAWGIRMTLNPNDDIHLGHFQSYKMTKHTRCVSPAANAHPQVDGVFEATNVISVDDDDGFYDAEYTTLGHESPQLHHTFGSTDAQKPAWFYLELDLPDPRESYNFMPIRWRLWTSSFESYSEGLPVGNQIPMAKTEGEGMIWDPEHETGLYLFEIQRIGFQTMRMGEGGFEPLANFAPDVTMEVRWP
jgi:hypothetical protein